MAEVQAAAEALVKCEDAVRDATEEQGEVSAKSLTSRTASPKKSVMSDFGR